MLTAVRARVLHSAAKSSFSQGMRSVDGCPLLANILLTLRQYQHPPSQQWIGTIEAQHYTAHAKHKFSHYSQNNIA